MFPFDQSNQPMYQQYAQAYDTGQSGGLDHSQMLGHVTQFMQSAPPSMQQGVLHQVFSEMEPGQRQSFAGQVPDDGRRPALRGADAALVDGSIKIVYS